MNPSKEDLLINKIDSIGEKASELGSRFVKRNEPKIMKLLEAFSKWLDRKLKEA